VEGEGDGVKDKQFVMFVPLDPRDPGQAVLRARFALAAYLPMLEREGYECRVVYELPVIEPQLTDDLQAYIDAKIEHYLFGPSPADIFID
jgi:hypothetical protein